MRLPFAEKSYINDQKLTGYCLSETHITGKHKARVFKSVLSVTADHYLILKEAILAAVLFNEAEFEGPNQQGNLYAVDFMMTYNGKQATVRTAWIILYNESFPRLISSYVKL